MLPRRLHGMSPLCSVVEAEAVDVGEEAVGEGSCRTKTAGPELSELGSFVVLPAQDLVRAMLRVIEADGEGRDKVKPTHRIHCTM